MRGAAGKAGASAKFGFVSLLTKSFLTKSGPTKFGLEKPLVETSFLTEDSVAKEDAALTQLADIFDTNGFVEGGAVTRSAGEGTDAGFVGESGGDRGCGFDAEASAIAGAAVAAMEVVIAEGEPGGAGTAADSRTEVAVEGAKGAGISGSTGTGRAILGIKFGRIEASCVAGTLQQANAGFAMAGVSSRAPDLESVFVLEFATLLFVPAFALNFNPAIAVVWVPAAVFCFADSARAFELDVVADFAIGCPTRPVSDSSLGFAFVPGTG